MMLALSAASGLRTLTEHMHGVRCVPCMVEVELCTTWLCGTCAGYGITVQQAWFAVF